MVKCLPVIAAGLDMSLGLVHVMIPHQSWGQTRADKSLGKQPDDPHNRDLSHRHAEPGDVIIFCAAWQPSVTSSSQSVSFLHSGLRQCLSVTARGDLDTQSLGPLCANSEGRT